MTASKAKLCVLALVLVVPCGAQQVAQLSPTVPANYTPKSIVLVPQGPNLRAIVSMIQRSRQVRCDVTAAPTVTTATPNWTRDQFCDAVWTPQYNGRLVTAHRFGGIRQWQASVPTFPLNQVSFTNTNYSHEGLKIFKDFVLYSEQHTSPTSQGGLEIYRMTGSGMSFVGQRLFTAGAGNAFEISKDGRVVWQWGDRNNTATDGVLRVYSTNAYTGNPILINTVVHPYVTPYTSKDLEGNSLGALHTNLLGAMGWDGLRAVNVTNPTSPVITTIIPPTNVIFVDGVTFFPNTPIAVVWGLFRFGSVDIDFISFWDATVPGLAILISLIPVQYRIDDIKAGLSPLRLYCCGRDRANSLAPVLLTFP